MAEIAELPDIVRGDEDIKLGNVERFASAPPSWRPSWPPVRSPAGSRCRSSRAQRALGGVGLQPAGELAAAAEVDAVAAVDLVGLDAEALARDRAGEGRPGRSGRGGRPGARWHVGPGVQRPGLRHRRAGLRADPAQGDARQLRGTSWMNIAISSSSSGASRVAST